MRGIRVLSKDIGRWILRKDGLVLNAGIISKGLAFQAEIVGDGLEARVELAFKVGMVGKG